MIPLNPEPFTLLKTGDAAYRRHDWQSADAAYRQAIAQTQNPQSEVCYPQWGEAAALARFRLAYVYAQQKRYDKAIATFQELLDHDAGTPQRDPRTLATLSERARYQIACCYRGLMREAKKYAGRRVFEYSGHDSNTRTPEHSTPRPPAEFYRQRAIAEFTRFIGQCPDSPLTHTAARAITDLNGGMFKGALGNRPYGLRAL